MSLLDDLAAKVKGALGTNSPAAGMIDHVIEYVHNTEASGGLHGVVQKFEQSGLGALVQSWISTGKNLPVSPDQVKSVLGSERISQWAAKLGISPEQANQQIAQVLPQVVDHLTPGGKLPTLDEMKAKIGGMLSRN